MPADEMAEYLQMYLDETGEHLEGLVEKLLALEENPADAVHLNEAFRLVHTIKGSSALMGYDNITELTHHLESQFERVRSGMQALDRALMDLSLKCVDYLRECNRRLRAGQPLPAAPDLLNALSGERPVTTTPTATKSGLPVATAAAPIAPAPAAPTPRDWRVLIRFEADLPLVDLKAQLAIARLSALGIIAGTLPAEAELARIAPDEPLQVLLSTTRTAEEIRRAGDVAGVALIEVEEGSTFQTTGRPPSAPAEKRPREAALSKTVVAEMAPAPPTTQAAAESPDSPEDDADDVAAPAVAAQETAASSKARVVETVRVDIDRLDNLMNLAGELVVNKARFVQIARQMGPAFKKSGIAGRASAFGDSMRRALATMRAHNGAAQNGVGHSANGDGVNWSHLNALEAEIGAFEEQARLWEESRRHFGHITEAIDQLTRVSDSLQRGVLDTRMVPVAPLFNRFKRVVRDISLELSKKVNLEIKGEKTELDKRMIDELNDPLIHLVRNSIDHGIEPADVRSRRGKPEAGTICLEASHSGNNVYIHIRDDGGGIDIDKIRRRALERGLAAPGVLETLSEEDLIAYIWHPGFSTAEVVSDISGRGVGMDIVKTRISELNGTVDVQHVSGWGTTFTIRLPLTLAIIRSLLFRLEHGTFAVPIDNVREIVSVPVAEIVTIHGRQTFEVRKEFIPLVDIDDVFDWHGRAAAAGPGGRDAGRKRIDVVILHSANKTMGLRVNELLGGQDIVIKSLAENFVHIRGLSGASILGDGSVCLLLDVGAAIELAGRTRRPRRD